MPGASLNDTEKKLKGWWESPSSEYSYPTLKGISVKGEPGLRGITDIDISFDYPLSVICGQNGSGKTTLLTLAALAFHSPDGHHSYQAKHKVDKSYYTFADFFFKGINDPDVTGVEILLKYHNKNLPPRKQTKKIKKQTRKWVKYETRHKRPVHYFGASRVLPAIERSVLRHHFNKRRTQHCNMQLNDTFLRIFSHILGRSYSTATVTQSDKHSLRSCEYGHTYSSFNMGAGEDMLIELLYYLQTSPNGSLIVIEEIELGLHPEAQRKLAQKLIEIAWDKKLQIIVSSHSFAFIDQVPRIARVLIQRTGPSTHNVIVAPTTRYAMGFLDSNLNKELSVYCEDSFAERILESVLPLDHRKRVNIIGIGSKDQVARQCGAHVRGEFNQKYLGVFDSDVGEEGMIKLMNKELPCSEDASSVNCYLLPENGLPPEKWIISEILSSDERIQSVADELNTENIREITSSLEIIDTIDDHHNISFEISKKMGVKQNEIEKILINAACKKNDKLNPFKELVSNILDGNN